MHTFTLSHKALLESLGDREALLLGKLWQGNLFSIEHDVLVRRRAAAGGEANAWYMPLFNLPDSCVGLWKVVVVSQDPFLFGFDLEGVGSMPLLEAVVDLDDWEGRPFRWLSLVGQVRALTLQRGDFGDGWAVRGLAIGDAEPLVQCAARNAFWGISKPVLDKLACERRIELPPGADLFSTIWTMVVSILGCSEGDALDILTLRLDPAKHGESDVAKELLSMDDGVAGLAPEDQQEVQKERVRATRCQRERQAFSAAFSAKRSVVRPVRDAPLGRSSRRRRQGSGPSDPPLTLPVGDLIQADLKPFVPPGGHVWRANKTGAWHRHYPPPPPPTSPAAPRAGGCMAIDGQPFSFCGIRGRNVYRCMSGLCRAHARSKACSTSSRPMMAQQVRFWQSRQQHRAAPRHPASIEEGVGGAMCNAKVKSQSLVAKCPDAASDTMHSGPACSRLTWEAAFMPETQLGTAWADVSRASLSYHSDRNTFFMGAFAGWYFSCNVHCFQFCWVFRF